ncbi:FKBP-type peptidyl-prolyl cis-trans isomerase, partial [Atlantibacter sp.]|uniref:FKBP-type peptidyl-prolyl cis-trans isomerase n=1 Tax=Atlantibacter sp. TaxID=1903473 RepID=UPI0028A7C35A
VKALSGTRDEKTQQTAQLEKTLAESQKQKADYQKQIAGLTSDQSAKAKALTELQQQLAERDKTLQALTAQVKALSGTRDEKTQQTAQLQAALEASQKKLAVLTDEQTIKTKALADLQLQLAERDKALQASNTQLKNALGAQDENAQRAGQLQKLLVASQEQAKAYQQQIAALSATSLTDKKTVDETQKFLSESRNKAATLEKKLNELTAAQREKDKTLSTLQQTLAGSQKDSEAIKAKWLEVSKQFEAQSKQLAELQKAKPAVAAKAGPVSKDEIRDYALGVYWAHEILNMIKSKEGYGYHIVQQQVLNGVNDEIANQLKISKDKLVSALKELDEASFNKETSLSKAALSEGSKYIAQFSKKAGVKRASLGYYYLVVDKGTGKIKSNDTVAVTMRESLPNGKVINDMSKKGSVLALPLNQFPPLFKSAISQLNNHGELRIVVPPELAYGEKGNMPDIPPNSTMIYDIKVVEVSPGTTKPAG